MQEAKRLRAAFLEKERNQGFLANLERLRAQGSVTSQQYAAMKHDYQQKMMSAVSEIASAKRQLSVKLQGAKQDLNSSKTALETLRAEYNTGNVSMAEYHRSEQKLTQRIDSTRTEVAHLQKLVEAKSSGEIAATETEGKPAKERRLTLRRWAVTVAVVVPLLVLGLLASFWMGGFPAAPEMPRAEPSPAPSEPAPPAETPQPPPPEPDVPSLTEIIAEVQPSVVLIACAKYTHSQDYDSSGSGVIVDKRGYILTNKHVVQRAQRIHVFLCKGGEVKVARGDEYEASVIKTHPTADLAIIKITPGYASLTEAVLGDSDSLRPGDKVTAIGYPLVHQFYEEASQSVGSPTVTGGMVSALRRYEGTPCIQIDTPLSGGNSGGALINTDGEIVGIPTFGFLGEKVQNINFAIAINYAKLFIMKTIGE